MKDLKRPDETYLSALLQNEIFFAVVAKIENRIVGGLTVYMLDQYYSKKSLAYIYDLAVLTEYQRKGIGKSLIGFVNDCCKKKGIEEVFVQADRIDNYAIDFYRQTKPTNEEQVVQFSYNLKQQ
jgi:aminoglycoside 3-N-acetyltransferase I